MSDHSKTPVPLARRETPETERIRHHHVREWSSGTRGGGKVPADFEWGTNPKVWQEENGAATPSGLDRPEP